jgi:hypothetical protein
MLFPLVHTSIAVDSCDKVCATTSSTPHGVMIDATTGVLAAVAKECNGLQWW